MSTIYSADGAPGKSWKLTRGSGGIQLWVPAKGKGSKQQRLPADRAESARIISNTIGVALEEVPQVLLDALQSTGEFLQSIFIPCVQSHLLLPCSVLFSCAEASKPINRSHLPQVHQAMMAIILNPCRLISHQQVRPIRNVHRTPRTHCDPCPIVRAKHAFTSISCFLLTSIACRRRPSTTPRAAASITQRGPHPLRWRR